MSIRDKLKSITGLGLVSDMFRDLAHLNSLPGQATIGHIRYSTSGGDGQLCNVLPFLAGHWFWQLVMEHDGNLLNYLPLRHKLEAQGSIFNNSQVILHLITTSSTTWMHWDGPKKTHQSETLRRNCVRSINRKRYSSSSAANDENRTRSRIHQIRFRK